MERNLLSDSPKEIPMRNIRPCLPPPLLALLLLDRSILTHVAWISPAHTVRFRIPPLNLLLLVKICTQSVRHWWARSANQLCTWPYGLLAEWLSFGHLASYNFCRFCVRDDDDFLLIVCTCVWFTFWLFGANLSMVGRRRSVDWWNEPTISTCV